MINDLDHNKWHKIDVFYSIEEEYRNTSIDELMLCFKDNDGYSYFEPTCFHLLNSNKEYRETGFYKYERNSHGNYELCMLEHQNPTHFMIIGFPDD